MAGYIQTILTQSRKNWRKKKIVQTQPEHAIEMITEHQVQCTQPNKHRDIQAENGTPTPLLEFPESGVTVTQSPTPSQLGKGAETTPPIKGNKRKVNGTDQCPPGLIDSLDGKTAKRSKPYDGKTAILIQGHIHMTQKTSCDVQIPQQFNENSAHNHTSHDQRMLQPKITSTPGQGQIMVQPKVTDNPGQGQIMLQPKATDNPGQGQIMLQPRVTDTQGQGQIMLQPKVTDTQGQGHIMLQPKVTDNPGQGQIMLQPIVTDNPGQGQIMLQPRVADTQGHGHIMLKPKVTVTHGQGHIMLKPKVTETQGQGQRMLVKIHFYSRSGSSNVTTHSQCYTRSESDRYVTSTWAY